MKRVYKHVWILEHTVSHEDMINETDPVNPPGYDWGVFFLSRAAARREKSIQQGRFPDVKFYITKYTPED